MKIQKSLLYSLFFFSGATSLVYESLWVRTLSLGVGSTSASLSMVLSIFFFGLSLGSYIGGKYAHRIKKPILAYGMMEGLSGVFALLILYPVLNFQQILSYLPIEDSFSTSFTIIKFAFVFILLLLPTICMGATLPLLIQICTQNNKEYGRSISFLYALNTFGAVAGAFSTSFFLVPSFGVYNAYVLTVGVSLLVWLSSYFLEKKHSLYRYKALDKKESWQFNKEVFNYQNILLLIIAGTIGFSAISAQVVWNKYLGVYFGTNIFGLGIILSIFLVGIALGSYTLSLYIEKVKNKFGLLLFFLLASCFSLVLTSSLLSATPIITNTLTYYFGEFVSVLLLKSVLSGLFLLPSTFVFGSILPLVIRLLAQNEKQASQVTGVAYSINTLGSILGAYLTGLYFVPLLGSSQSLKIAVVLLVLATFLLTLKTLPKVAQKVALVVVLGVFTLATFNGRTIDFRNIIKSAYFQNLEGHWSLSELMRYFSKDYEEFRFIYEGRTAIISLSNDQQDGEQYKNIYRLKTNGLNESVYIQDSLEIIPKYEGLLGFLPYLFARNPQSAFVVGYGGGYTVDFLTQTDLKKVFVSELEEGIIKASKFVYGKDHPILSRPSLELKIEDARYALAQNKNQFDIIVSQPSHSWLTGVANLFTEEYFGIVKSKLTHKGVFAQWLNLYNMSPQVVKSIFATFYKTFPHGYVFTNREDDELIMIGSKQDLKVQYNKLKQLSANPIFKNILQSTDFKSAEDFLTNYAFSRNTALNAAKGAVINSDLNAYAEVKQSQLFYSQEKMQEVKDFLAGQFTPDIYQELIKNGQDEVEFYSHYLNHLHENSRWDKFFTLLQVLEKNNKHIALVGEFCLQAERYDCALRNLAKSLKENPSSKNFNHLLSAYLNTQQEEAFFKTLRKYTKLKNDTTKCYELEAKVKFNRGRQFITAQKVKTLEPLCGDYLERSLASYYLKTKNFSAAQKYAHSYLQKHNQDLRSSQVMLALAIFYDDKKATQYYEDHLSEAKATEKARLQSLIDYYESMGWKKDAEYLKTSVL